MQNEEQNSITVNMKSPPASNARDRKPLFDHGRTSRTKKVNKTFYPALAPSGASTTKLPDAAAASIHPDSTTKVQMPQLQSHPSSSIQTNGESTLFSVKDSQVASG